MLSNVSGDTLAITGDGAADQITLRLASPRILQVEARPFNRTTFSRIAVRSGGGADEVRIDESGGVFTDTEITTIETGAGARRRQRRLRRRGDRGRRRRRLRQPGRGRRHRSLGAGDDTVLQDEADARDPLEGQSGLDTLRVLGTGQAEEFTVAGVRHARAVHARHVAGARRRGRDRDRRGERGRRRRSDRRRATSTAPASLRVDADLGVADGARDQVSLAGPRHRRDDQREDGRRRRAGLRAIELQVENAATRSTIGSRCSAPTATTCSGSNAVAPRIGITLDGGAGSDTLVGNSGTEVLRGGPGFDVAVGRAGDDVIDLGDGDDSADWNPGDGNDIIDGGSGCGPASLQRQRRQRAAHADRERHAHPVHARRRSPSCWTWPGSSASTCSRAPAPIGITVGDLTGTGITAVNSTWPSRPAWSATTRPTR